MVPYKLFATFLFICRNQEAGTFTLGLGLHVPPKQTKQQ